MQAIYFGDLGYLPFNPTMAIIMRNKVKTEFRTNPLPPVHGDDLHKDKIFARAIIGIMNQAGKGIMIEQFLETRTKEQRNFLANELTWRFNRTELAKDVFAGRVKDPTERDFVERVKSEFHTEILALFTKEVNKFTLSLIKAAR